MHIPITHTHEGYGSFKMPVDWAKFWNWRRGANSTPSVKVSTWFIGTWP